MAGRYLSCQVTPVRSVVAVRPAARATRRSRPEQCTTAKVRDNGSMATVAAATIPRTGPEIRAALAEHGMPGQVEEFVSELRDALTRAGETLDLGEADAVLDRWHALATMALNPLSDDERRQLARARAGDLAGLRTRNEHGDWVSL